MAAVEVKQIGRLGVDPEYRQVGKETAKKSRTTLFVLSNERWRDDSSDKPAERTTAIRWVMWGIRADNAAKFLKKGAKVAIGGRVENNEYIDRDGRKVQTFQFVATELQSLETSPRATVAESAEAKVAEAEQ